MMMAIKIFIGLPHVNGMDYQTWVVTNNVLRQALGNCSMRCPTSCIHAVEDERWRLIPSVVRLSHRDFLWSSNHEWNQVLLVTLTLIIVDQLQHFKRTTTCIFRRTTQFFLNLHQTVVFSYTVRTAE
jgi:hypothetical protein